MIKNLIRLLFFGVAAHLCLFLLPAAAKEVNISQLIEKARNGDAQAQFDLAVRYAKGEGVSKDPRKAHEWLAKAAEQGKPEAQCELGVSYALGKGVSKDPRKAHEWWERAAEQGEPLCQFNLGVSYEKSIGVQKNNELAEKYYTLSCRNGFEKACKRNRALTSSMELRGPVILGLQLGMESSKAVDKILTDGYIRNPEGLGYVKPGYRNIIIIFADDNKNVDCLQFYPGVFNAEGVYEKGFIDKFLKSYNIKLNNAHVERFKNGNIAHITFNKEGYEISFPACVQIKKIKKEEPAAYKFR